MKLSLCICVCVVVAVLIGVSQASPLVTRSNYRGKRGNNPPFISPPCNNETTLICRHMPRGDFEACMNPRAAREQVRLGHASLGECPDPCADCGNNQTTLSLGDLVDVNLAETGNRRKRSDHLAAGESLVSNGNGMFVLESHKITICHNPEGPSPQTIVISAQALQSHLAHGDIEGVCPDCFCSLDELEDVSIVNASDCHVVHFTEEGGWENKNIREIVNNTLADLDDTTIVNPEDCNVIHYKDGTWENKNIREIVNNTVVDLDDTCAENPQAGDHLVYNGTCYKNTNECPASCGNQDACPSGCDAVCPSACGGGVAAPVIRSSPPDNKLLNLEFVGPGLFTFLSNPCPSGTRVVTGYCSMSDTKGSVVFHSIGIALQQWACAFRILGGEATTVFAVARVVCEPGPFP